MDEQTKTIIIAFGLGLVGFGVYKILIKSVIQNWNEKVTNKEEYDKALKETQNDVVYGIISAIIGLILLAVVLGETL